MSPTESLLIAILVILTVMVVMGRKTPAVPARQRTWDCVDRGTGEITSVKMQYTGHGAGCTCASCNASPEKKATTENAEYFSTCRSPAECKQTMSCTGDEIAYAVDEFGAPGMEYKDWVTSQSVDTQVIKNHNEFVKDRLKDNSQNITGRTFALGTIETAPILWHGLRPPQALPQVGNPDQVPDVDYNLYTTKPKFTWSS